MIIVALLFKDVSEENEEHNVTQRKHTHVHNIIWYACMMHVCMRMPLLSIRGTRTDIIFNPL